MPKKKSKDNRPICTCSAYRFPHRIGGKCDGSAFTEFYRVHNGSLCSSCNCSRDGFQCDVTEGSESIEHAECYKDFKHYGGGHLPIKFVEPEYPEEYCDINDHLSVDF